MSEDGTQPRPSEEEREAALAVRNARVMEHDRLVRKIAAQYRRRRFKARDVLEFDDLLQEGRVGLIRAAENFNPAKGVQFSTYAYYAIQSHVLKAAREWRGSIRLPGHQQTAANRMDRAFTAAAQESRPPTMADLTAACARSEEELAPLLWAEAPPLSLDSSGESEEDHGPCGIEVADPNTPSEEAILLRLQLRAALDALPPRQATVLRLRYPLDAGRRPFTHAEVAAVIGCDRSNVVRIEQRALRCLRTVLGDDARHRASGRPGRSRAPHPVTRRRRANAGARGRQSKPTACCRTAPGAARRIRA